MCQNAITPASMCGIEVIALHNVSQCLAVCLNLDRETPYYTVELVQCELQGCELQQKWLVARLGFGGAFGCVGDGMQLRYYLSAGSCFSETLCEHGAKPLLTTVRSDYKWCTIETGCL